MAILLCTHCHSNAVHGITTRFGKFTVDSSTRSLILNERTFDLPFLSAFRFWRSTALAMEFWTKRMTDSRVSRNSSADSFVLSFSVRFVRTANRLLVSSARVSPLVFSNILETIVSSLLLGFSFSMSIDSTSMSFASSVTTTRDEHELELVLLVRVHPPPLKLKIPYNWVGRRGWRKPFTKNGVYVVDACTELLMANLIIVKISLQIGNDWT